MTYNNLCSLILTMLFICVIIRTEHEQNENKFVRYILPKGVYAMKFSERLVKLREYRGMTQSGLATEAGITTRALQNYETTERKPKGEYLIKLAKALNIPESALLSDEGLAQF